MRLDDRRSIVTVPCTSQVESAVRLWCGKRLDGAAGAAAFFVLAKRRDDFAGRPAAWPDRSEHVEGHQFHRQASCFRASVPDAMQYGLRLALDEVER